MHLLQGLADLRLKRMPVQFIIEEWDFMELTLKMNQPVFIPRPETEILATLASEAAVNDRNCLEIGTGTGAISLFLLHRNKQVILKSKKRE